VHLLSVEKTNERSSKPSTLWQQRPPLRPPPTTSPRQRYNGTVALDKQLVPGDYKVVAGDFTYTFTVSEKAVSNLDLANATLEVGKASYAFTGKALKPAVTVTSAMGATLVAGTDYTVSYASNTNVGKATVTITGAGAYTGTKSATFTITRVANPISATVKTPKKLTFATKKQVIANPLKVTKAQGSVTYAKVSGKAYFTVNKATGKITVAKSTPAGTYVVKVKATAAGGTNYKAGSVTKSFKVTVSKAANSLAVKAVKATQAATYDKNTTIAAAKAFKVTKNVSKGKVTYAKTKGNAKIVVASNGKITVKKGLKKGTYTIEVKATSKATANYKAASKTVALKVKVA
jgi:hypothetical protein